MITLNVGDMAQSLRLRGHNHQLRSELAVLSNELASGRAQDVVKNLDGHTQILSDMRRSLQMNAAFATSAKEAQLFAMGQQQHLSFLQEAVEEMTGALLTAAQSGLESSKQEASAMARENLQGMVASLNADHAGQALFSGDAVGNLAVISADEMLDEIRMALGGSVSMSDVQDVFDAWFDDAGGGFETVAYLGSDTSRVGFRITSTATVALDARADDPRLRIALKATAMAALAKDGSLGLAADVQQSMLERASELSLGAQSALTQMRASVGSAEARIEQAQTELSAQASGLQIAESELVSADPYETVVKLESAQLRLESLYAATSRLSQLSLLRYL